MHCTQKKIWKQLINYTSLHRINKHILSKSAYGIVFSNYMKTLIPGTNVIFHGSEPWSNTINMSQKELGISWDYPYKEG